MYTVKFCADSFALVKCDFQFDHIITDPPYTAHVHENMCSGSLVGKLSVPKYDLGHAPISSYAFVADLVARARRWVLMFCAVESFGEIQQYVGGFGKGNYVRSGIWYKPNSMGQLTGDRPAIAFEGIAMMHNPAMRKRWNGRGRYAHWICNGTRGEPARHPNQKPLALLCDLVREFTDLGETIFDPFCGSGRIGEAALLCGRGYVGLDSDPIWVERAEVRCAAAALRWGELAAAAHRVCVMKGTCPGAGAGADRA